LSAESKTITAYRLELCAQVAGVLRRGLNLLGIDAPEKM
jgi:arginyl-tRNA synthetase